MSQNEVRPSSTLSLPYPKEPPMNTPLVSATESWDDLLTGLTPRQLAAVQSAISTSRSSGWVPTRGHVKNMVDFSTGAITAREYAHLTLDVLGLAKPATSSPTYDPAAKSAHTDAEPRVGGALSQDTQSYARGELNVDEWLRRASARFHDTDA